MKLREGEVVEKDEVVRFEETKKRKDGLEYETEVMLTLLDYKGEKAVLSINRDITERKEAEERLERIKERHEELFRGSSQLVVTTDPEGYIKRVNRRTMEVSGYSEDELVGESVLKIAAPEQEDKYVEFWQKVMKEGEAKMTLKTQNKDGSNRWIRAGGRTITEDGEIVEIQYTSQDISELVRTRRREKFLHSLLRHDVRNKAQVVKGYLELLEDTGLSEEQKKFVEKAKRGSEDGIEIIEKVRTLREVGEAEEIEEVGVEPFIENAISKMESQASGRGIDIECDKCECKVRGGPLLEELFSNLVENSIAHSGCEKIRISSEETEDECVVKIEDDGHGVPGENKDKIFEKGFTTAEKRGTGLGLYLVKEIAESYGGSIRVKDSEMGGARFDLHLQKV